MTEPRPSSPPSAPAPSSAPSSPRRLRALFIALSTGALVLLLPIAVLWLVHVAQYNGICGPHAPDIAAHACSAAEYRAEFAAGFAGVGLFLLEVFLVAPVALAAMVGAWFLALRSGRGRERTNAR